MLPAFHHALCIHGKYVLMSYQIHQLLASPVQVSLLKFSAGQSDHCGIPICQQLASPIYRDTVLSLLLLIASTSSRYFDSSVRLDLQVEELCQGYCLEPAPAASKLLPAARARIGKHSHHKEAHVYGFSAAAASYAAAINEVPLFREALILGTRISQGMYLAAYKTA